MVIIIVNPSNNSFKVFILIQKLFISVEQIINVNFIILILGRCVMLINIGILQNKKQHCSSKLLKVQSVAFIEPPYSEVQSEIEKHSVEYGVLDCVFYLRS